MWRSVKGVDESSLFVGRGNSSQLDLNYAPPFDFRVREHYSAIRNVPLG